MKKIKIFLVAMAVLVLLSFGYNEKSYITRVSDNGVIYELKVGTILDRDEKYSKGQKYKVTHKFYLNELVGRKIELVEK